MSSKSCRVWFRPGGEIAEVSPGTHLLEAAVQAGLLIEAECGGKGTCGSCLMEAGPASHEGEILQGEEPRFLYGCRTPIERDLVATPLGTGLGKRRRIVTGTSYLLGQRTQLAPEELDAICRRLLVQVPPPSIDLCMSDRERLVRAVCQAANLESVSLDLDVLRRLPDALRRDEGRVTVTLWREGAASVLTDVHAGHAAGRHLGVVCDLGTSTVVLKLVDLETGKALAVASDYNRQVRSGADVISRIDHAARPGGLERLRHQAVTTINVILRRLRRQVSIEPEAIRALVVSGNTTMIHLLLGVSPRYLREEPYVPAFTEIPAGLAAELGIEIDPMGKLLCVPAVGSFVGGDIVSGILCQRRFNKAGEVFLFIDVGTNGEVVVGSDDWLLGCACSAGPAFEGAGVGCGMRAVPGAIERIELSEEGEVRSYDVIGGGKPRGLCGSALIQLLGELLATGLIDRRGHLRSEPAHPRIIRFGRVRAYVVERGENTQSGTDIVLTEIDIDNLVRAKGAIYSGCSLLLRKVGLGFEDLDTVYIAGGFGRYIAVERAVAIGMLPDLDPERFVFLGNSSLAGVTMALLSSEQRDLCMEIARAMTYVELSADPDYMNEYTGALFLPHTDLSRFSRAQPTAAARGE